MSAATKPALDELRAIDLLADLDDATLRSFADAATMHQAVPGQRISEYGQRASGLTLLLEGESEKMIAARLGLSPLTVHQYITELYRRYGVASRAELLAHFIPRR